MTKHTVKVGASGGYFADENGPRNVGILSAVLSSTGFLGTSFIHSKIVFNIYFPLTYTGSCIRINENFESIAIVFKSCYNCQFY